MHVQLIIIICNQEQGTLAAWKSSAWAQKLENKQKRANLGDFDRFKLMVARKQRSALIKAAL